MLTIQFIPYSEIETLDSNKRIAKILKLVKEEKIVLLEGKLKSKEETDLIKKTMESIDSKFKGIELSVINQDNISNKRFFQKLKYLLLNLILGDRKGFTIIGPATIVKEIKNDPDKIQLLTEDTSSKKK